MKKIILAILALTLFSVVSHASEQQRKVSTGSITTATAVKATPGVLYDVEILATGANAWVAVYDSSSKNSPQTGTKLVEVGEATSGNSKHVNLGVDGINAAKGITVWTSNASVILYYR